jgi:hypothetical protein
MTSKQHQLDAYKRAIRSKFEQEKDGEYSSFLISPSRAKLRQLCVERFKNNTKTDDLTTFHLFFGFEFGLDQQNKLQTQTDKFRPIETFLKGETDLTDIEGINLAAILVGFSPRPFKKFSNQEANLYTKENEELEHQNRTTETSNKKSKTRIAWFAGVVVLITVIYAALHIFNPQEQCMQWKDDHYEPVACALATEHPTEVIIPLDKQLIHLKKINVSATTTFWVAGKPVVWYTKVNGKPEFFNGFGLHPVTGKALKPISKYIIKKYILKQNKSK